MNFTVIIPCFNASKTISIALDSLVSQTYTNFDIILIDDASNDYLEMLNIVKTYQPQLKINVIRNLINKNGAYARNEGIKLATSEYVAFLDSDDSWVPTRLENAFNIIINSNFEHYICYGKFELIQNHHTGALLPIRGIGVNELVAEYVFAAGQSMQTSTFFCPLCTAKLVMFDETLSRHQDSDFMMRAQDKGIPIIYQEIKCADYRIKSIDVRSRVATGRINSAFCIKWIENKKQFFNLKALSGYKLNVYARVLYLEGHLWNSFRVASHGLIQIGWLNFLDLLKVKFMIFYKSRLGVSK